MLFIQNIFIEMFLLGTFLIKPQKKAEAEKKFAKHLGMIAGGTGKAIFIIWNLWRRKMALWMWVRSIRHVLS